MTVDLNVIELNIVEEFIAFSWLDIRTWFWWRPKRFRVQFRIPATEPYEVSECYGIPQLTRKDRFECTLLTTFMASEKRVAKMNSFIIDLPCPSSADVIAFSLAVQVKHGITVHLE
jgi:hypothetical protein